MDDRVIICDTHIWTEIDLDTYVRNYYVRAVFRWHISIQTTIWNFLIFNLEKKPLFIDDRMIVCDTHIWTEIDLESYWFGDKLEPFSCDAYQSRPDLKFSNI